MRCGPGACTIFISGRGARFPRVAGLLDRGNSWIHGLSVYIGNLSQVRRVARGPVGGSQVHYLTRARRWDNLITTGAEARHVH